MHYLYYQALENARRTRMTDGEREAQLISRIYGNVHLELPEVTRDMVRQQLLKRRARGVIDGTVR